MKALIRSFAPVSAVPVPAKPEKQFLIRKKKISEFSQAFPGAASIIETWFINYEGPGKVQTEGFGSFEEANSLLNDARKGFELSSVIANEDNDDRSRSPASKSAS